MKQKSLDRLRVMQQQYHRNNNWRLSEGGIFIPHCYKQFTPEKLSWWDDVGFILNGRRIIVWWQHPRDVYQNAIQERAWAAAGDRPKSESLMHSTPNYKRVGRSRKKIVSYTLAPPSAEWGQYFENLRAMENQLQSTGIDFVVRPSVKVERLNWAMGMSLVAPIEVRSNADAIALASLARRLILGQTTLEAEFPGYHYSKDAWLSEASRRNR